MADDGSDEDNDPAFVATFKLASIYFKYDKDIARNMKVIEFYQAKINDFWILVGYVFDDDKPYYKVKLSNPIDVAVYE